MEGSTQYLLDENLKTRDDYLEVLRIVLQEDRRATVPPRGQLTTFAPDREAGETPWEVVDELTAEQSLSYRAQLGALTDAQLARYVNENARTVGAFLTQQILAGRGRVTEAMEKAWDAVSLRPELAKKVAAELQNVGHLKKDEWPSYDALKKTVDTIPHLHHLAALMTSLTPVFERARDEITARRKEAAERTAAERRAHYAEVQEQYAEEMARRIARRGAVSPSEMAVEDDDDDDAGADVGEDPMAVDAVDLNLSELADISPEELSDLPNLNLDTDPEWRAFIEALPDAPKEAETELRRKKARIIARRGAARRAALANPPTRDGINILFSGQLRPPPGWTEGDGTVTEKLLNTQGGDLHSCTKYANIVSLYAKAFSEAGMPRANWFLPTDFEDRERYATYSSEVGDYSVTTAGLVTGKTSQPEDDQVTVLLAHLYAKTERIREFVIAADLESLTTADLFFASPANYEEFRRAQSTGTGTGTSSGSSSGGGSGGGGDDDDEGEGEGEGEDAGAGSDDEQRRRFRLIGVKLRGDMTKALYDFFSAFLGWAPEYGIGPPDVTWTRGDAMEALRIAAEVEATLQYVGQVSRFIRRTPKFLTSKIIEDQLRMSKINLRVLRTAEQMYPYDPYEQWSMVRFDKNFVNVTAAIANVTALDRSAAPLHIVDPDMPKLYFGNAFQVNGVLENMVRDVSIGYRDYLTQERDAAGNLKMTWKISRAMLFLANNMYSVLVFRDLYPEAYILAHRPVDVTAKWAMKRLAYDLNPTAHTKKKERNVPTRAADYEMHDLYEWWSRTTDRYLVDAAKFPPKRPANYYSDTRGRPFLWERSWWEMWPEMPTEETDRSVSATAFDPRELQVGIGKDMRVLRKSPINILDADRRSRLAMGPMFKDAALDPRRKRKKKAKKSFRRDWLNPETPAADVSEANHYAFVFMQLAHNSWNAAEFYVQLNRLFKEDATFARLFHDRVLPLLHTYRPKALAELARRTVEEIPFLWNAVVRAVGETAYTKSFFLPLDYLPSQEFMQPPFVLCPMAREQLLYMLVGTGVAGLPTLQSVSDYDVQSMDPQWRRRKLEEQGRTLAQIVTHDPFQLPEWRDDMLDYGDGGMHPEFRRFVGDTLAPQWEAVLHSLTAFKQVNYEQSMLTFADRVAFYREYHAGDSAFEFFVKPRLAHRRTMMVHPADVLNPDLAADYRNVAQKRHATLRPDSAADRPIFSMLDAIDNELSAVPASRRERVQSSPDEFQRAVARKYPKVPVHDLIWATTLPWTRYTNQILTGDTATGLYELADDVWGLQPGFGRSPTLAEYMRGRDPKTLHRHERALAWKFSSDARTVFMQSVASNEAAITATPVKKAPYIFSQQERDAWSADVLAFYTKVASLPPAAAFAQDIFALPPIEEFGAGLPDVHLDALVVPGVPAADPAAGVGDPMVLGQQEEQLLQHMDALAGAVLGKQALPRQQQPGEGPLEKKRRIGAKFTSAALRKLATIAEDHQVAVITKVFTGVRFADESKALIREYRDTLAARDDGILGTLHDSLTNMIIR